MMIKLRDSHLKRLSEIAFAANTPGYLVGNILREDTLLQFARSLATADIVETLETIADKAGDEARDEDALTAFALAISLQNREIDAIRSLKEIQIPWLRWWQEVVRRVVTRARDQTWVSSAADSLPATTDGRSNSDESQSSYERRNATSLPSMNNWQESAAAGESTSGTIVRIGES